MTSNKEDYLMVIYQHGGYTNFIQNKIISDNLKISPSSVSEMLGKLKDQKLIEYEAYVGSKLTNKGWQICLSIIRKHHILETFMINYLNFKWEDAHNEAHILEHVCSNLFIDSLDSLLNYPKTSNQGAIIPRDNKYKLDTMPNKLIDLNINEEAIIIRFDEEQLLIDYLNSNNIKLGSKIKIIFKDSYDGPIKMLLNNKEVLINNKAANKIFIDNRSIL